MTPPNPLEKYLYGGLPEGGGYECYTMMELGAQHIAEAAHCILGSLGRTVGPTRTRDWRYLLRYEVAHIKEEMGIIRKRVFKYSECGWDHSARLHMNDFEGEYAPYVAMTVESVRRVSPKLRARAESMRAALEAQSDVPEKLYDVAIACYDLAIALTLAMESVVINWPERRITNPYVDARLVEATKALEEKVAELVEFEWH
jgi:hypothetical protein